MNTFNKITSWFFGLTTFFLTAFLLIFPGNLFPATRLFVVFLFTAAAFSLWGAKNFLKGGLIFLRTNFYLPLAAFFVLTLISLLILPFPGSLNDAFFGTGGMILFLILFFVAAIQFINLEGTKSASLGFSLAALLIALISILSYLSLLNKIIPVSVFSQNGFINGENGYYLTAFFAVFLVLGIVGLFKNESMVTGAISLISAIIGLGTVGINFLKVGNSAVFLPFSSGWAMTIELFKNLKNLIIGIGFNQFGIYSPLLRTPELNTDKYIFLRFPQTSNGVFEILDSLGILGFLLFCFFIFKFYQALKGRELKLSSFSAPILYFVPLSVLLISFFFLPLNPILLFMFFMFLILLVFGLKAESSRGYDEIKLQIVRENEGFLSFQTGESFEKHKYAPKFFAVLSATLFIVVFYFALAYPVLAEVHFAKYLRAVSQNLGKTAYDEMNAAAFANRKSDLFYGELARINFQLALSLNSQKNLTGQDKQNITILVNQAVTAARTATQVNPQKETNWESLASLFEALIQTDETSKNLAAQAYLQAVNLNPQDPVLRVRFAQMLYAAKAYQDAINQLNVATAIKSDFANAYYNLGLNYKQLAQTENAKQAFNMALRFVKKGTEDEKTLNREIAGINELPPETQVPPNPPASESAKTEPPKTDLKLTGPSPAPELNNLRKEFLDIQPATASGTPTP